MATMLENTFEMPPMAAVAAAPQDYPRGQLARSSKK
jgi:hypothetical protein